jgi:undecaprenyl-diphosphatase
MPVRLATVNVAAPSLAEIRSRDRRGLAIVAVLALIPFVLLAWWARYMSPADWEVTTLQALATNGGPLALASSTLNMVGNLPLWAIVVGLTSLLVWRERGGRAAALVALTFASDLMAFLVKLLVERGRPDTEIVRQFYGPDSFSYPSGHTVRAAAFVATLIWVFAPVRLRLPLAVIGGALAGAVMGYARVSLGVHWPTDVIGGTLLGLAWFAVTAALLWVEPFGGPSPSHDEPLTD